MDGANRKARVLFLCTHDSARSQVTEGLPRRLARQTGASFEASSAGTEETGVKPEARTVMAEIGIDISDQGSKTLDRYLGERFDYVVTVCDAANDSCPAFPGPAERLHWSLPDPSAARGGEEERLAVSRSAGDLLKRHVRTELIGRGR